MTSTDCSNCQKKYYDEEASSTSQVVDPSTYELAYGSATLYGEKIMDTVCLTYSEANTNACLTDFEFFKITSAKGLFNDGILGLSPDVTSNGPSFMGALKK